ncbi:MAG: aspartate/glutamate racemase family protein [Hyphomicrobiaceae bacterium]|nr:Asp/Glu racemase [Hyphomicrobiaceae bacterium]
MRLLLINPNTTDAMTNRMLELGRALVEPGVELTGVTGRFGARYVASRASYAIAGHSALDCYAEHGQGVDAVLLACFGDPGLFALRELADCPVVGMAEASCATAAERGRFSIVTGGERWGSMLEEFVASIGFSSQLAGVTTVAPTGADIARDPKGSIALLAEACRHASQERAASSVILGGAGLAGLAGPVGEYAGVPVIDSFEALMKAGIAAASHPLRRPSTGPTAKTPPVETIGLSSALTRSFGNA